MNISSAGTKVALPSPVYIASKLALEGLTVCFTRDLAAKGIRINTVSPGYTDTDMLAAGGPDLFNAGVAASPLNRVGKSFD